MSVSSMSVSRSILAAVLASVFVLTSVALYRGAPARSDTRQDLAGAVESVSEIEPVSEVESLPGDETSTAAGFFGVCAYTCEPCWHTDDCPLLGGFPQSCQWACH